MENKKVQFVKDLKPGSLADSIFLVTKKIIKKKKNAEDYCLICIQDKSGSMDGVIWTDAFLNTGPFAEGDFALVKGEVSDYKGARQLTVSSFIKIGPENEKNLDPADYIKASSKNISEMFQQLKFFMNGISNPYLKKLLGLFFDDEKFSEKFCSSTAAVQYHHAYTGGLLEHTLSMVRLCSGIIDNYRDIKAVNDDFKDLAIAGSVLHDIGKMEEYGTEKKGALIKITDEGKLLGHISIGYGIILQKIGQINNFPTDLKDRLLHIILSHHGHKEFGSPKQPKTLEAFLVYHVDHLDADIAGIAGILENSSGGSDWSEYLKNFERSILLKEPNFPEEPVLEENDENKLFK